MNRVTVIIPSYNRSGLINETVRCVLAQSLAPHEVIVVDDGSTDDSVESLRSEFGDAIQLIEQANQGPGAARNTGLNAATGEFVWLMDSDDLASRNKLQTQVAALSENEADVVYSPWARVFFKGDQVRLDGQVLQQRQLPSKRDPLTWFMTDWSLVFQHCLFRTSALRRAGRYRDDIWTCDDSEYFARILCHDAKVIFDDESITLYRLDDHAKVTGSGFAVSRRVTDWGKCLVMMHDQVKAAGFSSHQHPEFQLRIRDCFQELQRNSPEEVDLIEQLQSRLSGRFLAARAYSKRLAMGLRRRRTGQTWSVPYQCAPLTASQQKLIKQMGYDVHL